MSNDKNDKNENSIPKLKELLTQEKKANSTNIDKITDKIYLGSEEGAKEYDFLKTEQISHIISIISDPPIFPEDMNMICLNLNEENCLVTGFFKHLKECINFFENANKVFIHCSCGVDRSPTIVIGYLMWKTHCSYNEVYNYLKGIRNCIEPNNLFVIKLHKLDNLLKKHNYELDKIDMK